MVIVVWVLCVCGSVCRHREWPQPSTHRPITPHTPITPYSKADWLREVTEGSKASIGEGEGGEGTWVVVHLYQDRCVVCWGMVVVLLLKKHGGDINKCLGPSIFSSLPNPPNTIQQHNGSVEECRLLNEQVLPPVARKFKAVKFVKIVATSAVENWPDRNLPTLFIYRGGELQTQLLGVKRLGGRGATPDGGCLFGGVGVCV